MISKRHPARYAKYQVILKSPGERAVPGASRSEKIRVLREIATDARAKLIGWIRDHDLTEQVVEISEPNPFNMVYVVTEPAAARKLKRAPNVDSVSPAGEVAVDLALNNR